MDVKKKKYIYIYTTPFHCFRKPAPEAAAAAASGDTLQTDDRNINIIETTEN